MQRNAEPLNKLDYIDNPAEFEVQRELRRLGVQNAPQPDDGCCPTCHQELKSSSGYVGETILYCSNGCFHWEDAEGAIRRVF
jgi:hypothetical protein